jgi:hypothetical protein
MRGTRSPSSYLVNWPGAAMWCATPISPATRAPKGETARRGDDPVGFSVQPIELGAAYSKRNLLQRHVADGRYGRLAAAALEEFQPDVALVANTALNALSALQDAAARRGAGFILWLQDSFGLAAAALLKDRWLGAGRLAAAWYQTTERRALRRCDRVIAISPDFVPYWARPAWPPDRVAVIPNWGPLSAVKPRPKRNDWAAAQGLQGSVTIAWASAARS